MLDGHVQLGHHSPLDPIWYLTDVHKQRSFFHIHVSPRREQTRPNPISSQTLSSPAGEESA